MFNKNLTIKELYEELDVTKQTVHNHIKNLVQDKLLDEKREKNLNGIIVLTPKEQHLLYVSIKGEEPRRKDDKNTHKDIKTDDSSLIVETLRQELSYIRGQLESKNRQIDSQKEYIDKLHEQIENTTTLLDQSQKLQLQIQNHLDSTTKENKSLLEYKEKNWFQRFFRQ